MKLTELLDVAALHAAIDAGYIRERQHPTLPYSIFNYTEAAQYERHWTRETLTCRGLIVDRSTGTVIARPWRKFFNWGEHEQGKIAGPQLDLGAPVEVSDKMDGSLGILYPVLGGHAVATRGSFLSDQALHASQLYADRYNGRWAPRPWLTYLFEIVYPGNRIVLDYGATDDLVLLGAVDTAKGQTFGPADPYLRADWPGPRTEVFGYRTLREALAAEPRPNAEGLVVRFPDTDVLVKIKQDDYVALHRLITGLSERVVWERIGVGETVASICRALPDEFHDWVKRVAAGLYAEQARILAGAQNTHADILAGLPEQFERRDYAAEAARSEFRPWLFNLLDGRDPSPGIWKTLKPAGDTRMMHVSEDVA